MYNSENSELAELWASTAPAEKKAFSNVPDGKYEAVVSSVRLEKSKNGKDMIAWDLIINNGCENGKHVFNNQVLGSAKQVSYVQRSLLDLGFDDVSTLDAIQSVFAELIDCVVAITLKTRPATPEYEAIQNVYINKVLVKMVHNEVQDYGF